MDFRIRRWLFLMTAMAVLFIVVPIVVSCSALERTDPTEAVQTVKKAMATMEAMKATAEAALKKLEETGRMGTKDYHELQAWMARISSEIQKNERVLQEWETNQAAREAAVARGEMTPEEANAMGWRELIEALGATAVTSILASLGITWKLRGSPANRKGNPPKAA